MLLGLAALPFTVGGCERCTPGQVNRADSGEAPAGKVQPARAAGLRARIQALPYLATAPVKPEDRKKVGVTLHLEGKVGPGLTAYCSEETDEVLWADLQGGARHHIHVPRAQCKLLEPTGQGDFLVLGDGSLTRLGWDGEVRWQQLHPYNPGLPGRQSSFHHDLDVTRRGRIYVLTNHNRLVSFKGARIPVRDDEITLLTAKGKRVRSFSLFDMLGKRWVKPARLERIREEVKAGGLEAVGWGDITDVLHVNTLEVLEKGTPFGRPGQVLIAARYLDLVALLDLRRKEVVWSWGPGVVEWPHHPTVLANGNLLIFDNGSRRRWSRVIELDPRKGEIVWSYRAGEGADPFFSDTRGSAQALPGGTVLITESDTGRVFEVTRQGKIVWEFWNPEVLPAGEAGELSRRLIYRAVRYGPGSLKIEGFKAMLDTAPPPARPASPDRG